MNTENENMHGEYWENTVPMFPIRILKSLVIWVISLFIFFPSLAVAWTEIGINFRDSSGYVTDGTDETYALGETDAYPVTRGGATFGWTVAEGDSGRDRDSGLDRRLAGMNSRSNSGTQSIFQLDLTSAGDYRVCIALGEASNTSIQSRLDVLDNATPLFTVGPALGAGAAEFGDATGVVRTAAAWAADNVCQNVTFATTTAVFKLGTLDVQAGSSTIAHIYVGPQIMASPSPSPSPSATPLWTQVGINFRATSGYVTDGTDEIYNLNEAYPTVRGNVTAGWVTSYVDAKRDRDSGLDRRLAGINGVPNNGTPYEFRVDLPSAGDYRICLAVGDAVYGSPNGEQVRVLDNVTSKFVASTASPFSAANYLDATSIVRTAAAWPGSQACQDVTFASTTAIFKVGTDSYNVGDTHLAHIYIGPQVMASPSPSPSPSASGTPSPTPIPGAIPEIPGMGVGTTAKVSGNCPSGYGQAFDDPALCSLLMPSDFADRDRDGYVGSDCDDTNPAIFDGVYTTSGCGAGLYRRCTAGAYTSCTTATLCEAGSGGTCYYVNPTSGSNSNSGTYSFPFHDLRKVSQGYAGGVTLNPGDVVYLVGSGTITDTAVLDTTTNAFYSYRSGAAGNPITLKQYPGSTVAISVSNAYAVHIPYPARYWKVEGMRATNNNTDKQVLLFNSARDTEIRLNYIYDSKGNGSDNTSGIYHTVSFDNAQHESIHIHNNYVKNYRHNGSSSIDNVTSFLLMNSDNDGDDGDIRVQFNRAWDTDPNSLLSSACYKRKHGLRSAASGISPMQWTDNYCVNAKIGMNIGAGLVNVTRNVIYNARDTAFQIYSGDSDTARQTSFTYNTSINSGRNFVIPNFLNIATDNIVFKNNIYTSTLASYSGSGANYICWAGECVAPQPDVLTTKNTDIYDADNNCYYNSITPVRFGWFPYTGGSSEITFASYKTFAGDDELNSFIEDPVFDSNYAATASNCVDKGWLAEDGLATPTPTPSVTPTPSTTPTSTPSVGASASPSASASSSPSPIASPTPTATPPPGGWYDRFLLRRIFPSW